MSMTTMESMRDEAKAWVFGASRPIDKALGETIHSSMGRFIDEWTSHGSDLPAAFAVVDDRFLVVAADDGDQPGGCSIDRLFKLMSAFEKELGVPMLDSTLVFYRDSSDEVCGVTRLEFRAMAERGDVDSSTIVYDTAIDRVEFLRDGTWRKPAADSWHGKAFGLQNI